MSSFICPDCGKEIIDSPNGYKTGCEHFPAEDFERDKEYLEECEAMTEHGEESKKRGKILKFRTKEQKESDNFRDRVHEDLINNHIIVKDEK